jgi:hypothetical protein
VEEVRISGYMCDLLTQDLLGLSKNDKLLHSSTYGLKEPGLSPVNFSLLCKGPIDWLILPFVAQSTTCVASQFSLHSQNDQYFVHSGVLQSMKEMYDRS